MTEKTTQIAGYGMLVFLSVLLWNPFIVEMNANLPSDTVGEALGLFFWLVYPIVILYLIYRLLNVLVG
jgi:hypothetical protein